MNYSQPRLHIPHGHCLIEAAGPQFFVHCSECFDGVYCKKNIVGGGSSA